MSNKALFIVVAVAAIAAGGYMTVKGYADNPGSMEYYFTSVLCCGGVLLGVMLIGLFVLPAVPLPWWLISAACWALLFYCPDCVRAAVVAAGASMSTAGVIDFLIAVLTMGAAVAQHEQRKGGGAE